MGFYAPERRASALWQRQSAPQREPASTASRCIITPPPGIYTPTPHRWRGGLNPRTAPHRSAATALRTARAMSEAGASAPGPRSSEVEMRSGSQRRNRKTMRYVSSWRQFLRTWDSASARSYASDSSAHAKFPSSSAGSKVRSICFVSAAFLWRIYLLPFFFSRIGSHARARLLDYRQSTFVWSCFLFCSFVMV